MRTSQINQSFDLLSLVETDTEIKRTGAGWWAGPCPFCGGTDRFTLKQTSTGWRWYCRHCGGDQYHTSVDYIMQRQACTFPEALNWIKNTNFDSTPRSQVAEKLVTASIPDGSPQVWQARGFTFMEICTATLWSEAGAPALSWLHARGLQDHTLRKYKIGYNPRDTFEELPSWGLPTPDDGARHAVWLPRGIVIPCCEDQQLWYLKIRRPLSPEQMRQGKQKYVKVKGSQSGLFGAWNLRGAWLAVLTEGELDCMVLDQEVGDLAGVATLGSVSDRINRLDLAIWGKWILPVAHFLIAYDLDAPGAKGSRALECFTERAIKVSLPELPGVKDITDFYLAGSDLGNWLARAVEQLKLLKHGNYP